MQKREMQYSKSWCACWASWAGHRIQWQCTITCASIFLELTLLLIDLYWKLTLLHCYIVNDQLILKPLLHCQWSTFIKYIVTLLHTLSLINFHQNSGGEGSRKKEQRRTRFYDRSTHIIIIIVVIIIIKIIIIIIRLTLTMAPPMFSDNKIWSQEKGSRGL